MRKFTFFGLGLCCLLLFAITQTNAQTGFPTCSKPPKCVSNDLEVAGAFLTSTQCTCTSGTITATLNMKINNKTGSQRTSFAFFANLVQTDPTTGATTTSYITNCDGPVAPNGITTLSFPNQQFICGRVLTLTNVYLAWTDASDGKSCPLAFCSIAPKCGFPQTTINIVPLLSATASTSAACEGQSDGSITVTPTGGTSPYTYSKNGTDYQTSATFSNLAAGSYTLYVKDNATTPCIFSFSKTLGSKTCCTAPTISTNPSDATKCDGASATFTAAATGGSPTPTVKWQVSTDGTNYSDLTNSSPYSGVTTTTLTVNPVATGLNGNKYRAVFTSGDCTPAATTGASLTVNGIPGAPSATYNAPACDATTFSVTISGVSSGASYAIVDKDGNAIANVSPASPFTAPNNSNFSFSNIPAGSGYKVSVTKSGCLSSTSNCGSSTLRVQNTSVVEPLTTDPLTKVKVAPNPYNDRIRFTFQSSESGKGALELYNLMGQRIQTVFEGYIEKGQMKNIEYSVPFSQRAMMVYVFRIGNQKIAGKLVSVR